MKLPKKVYIAGVEWRVRTDPHKSGGMFDGAKFEITVGTKYPQYTLNTFLHEVIEALMSERRLRYVIPYDVRENGHYLFSFNHKEYEDLIMDLSLVLKDLIKGVK